MTKTETWAEREQRLAEGRSSPTGWPVKLERMTIPAKPRKSKLNVEYLAKCGTITGGVK